MFRWKCMIEIDDEPFADGIGKAKKGSKYEACKNGIIKFGGVCKQKTEEYIIYRFKKISNYYSKILFVNS